MARRIFRLIVLGAGLIAMVTVVLASLDRRLYFAYREVDRARWEYPTTGVLLVVAAVALETAVAYGVFLGRRPPHMWARALLGLGVLIPITLAVGLLIVHTPMFWLMHVAWLWGLDLAISVAMLVSGSGHAWSVLRARGAITP